MVYRLVTAFVNRFWATRLRAEARQIQEAREQAAGQAAAWNTILSSAH